MSQAASQAAIFYRDVEATGKLWTLKDEGGFPAPKNSEGIRTMPFWSSKSRVELIIKNVAAYNDFEPVEISIDEFYNCWLMKLKADGQLVGVNWSGKNAIGYDLKPEILIKWIREIRPVRSGWIKRLIEWKT